MLFRSREAVYGSLRECMDLLVLFYGFLSFLFLRANDFTSAEAIKKTLSGKTMSAN